MEDDIHADSLSQPPREGPRKSVSRFALRLERPSFDAADALMIANLPARLEAL
jgi:hypothetical protein